MVYYIQPTVFPECYKAHVNQYSFNFNGMFTSQKHAE